MYTFGQMNGNVKDAVSVYLWWNCILYNLPACQVSYCRRFMFFLFFVLFMNVTSFTHQLTLFGNMKGKVQRKWYQNRGGLSVALSAVLIHWGLGCDLNLPQTPTLINCEPVAPTTTPLYLFARTRRAVLC